MIDGLSISTDGFVVEEDVFNPITYLTYGLVKTYIRIIRSIKRIDFLINTIKRSIGLPNTIGKKELLPNIIGRSNTKNILPE